MLTYQKRRWVIQQVHRQALSITDIARAQKVSRQTIYDLKQGFQQGGLEALKEHPRGRKVDAIPEYLQEQIIRWRKKHYGIHKIRAMLRQDQIDISKQKIDKVLQWHRLQISAPKKGRRYDYIRWERKHSNSLWQTDYCWIERLGCWLTGWLDDHSRLLTSASYVTEATTENAIKLFEKGVKTCGLPRETLSDRGTQYYSNHPGNPSHFFGYMKSRGVQHIYASVKKPTTCGKMERFWRTHHDERWAFRSLNQFVQHYNHSRPHMSLGYKTPYEVWKRDLKV